MGSREREKRKNNRFCVYSRSHENETDKIQDLVYLDTVRKKQKESNR